MKRIIKGKTYNTETAKLIDYHGEGEGEKMWEEYLYRTKSGDFFLHGRGGKRTWYLVVKEGKLMGSEQIIPLSKGNAIKWLKDNYDFDLATEILEEME